MTLVKPIFACAACMSTFFVVGATVEPAMAAEPVTVTAKRVPADTPTAIVKYGDLQLASASDQKILTRRVGDAVREVCVPNGAAFENPYIVKGCKDYAWDGARPQMASAIQRAQLNGSSLSAATMTITIAGR